MFKNGNFWPYVITIFLIAMLSASYSTIKIAVDNPVQSSNIFLNNYHVTDKNINQILTSQIAFKSRYDLDYSNSSFDEKGFHLVLKVLEDGQKVQSSIEGIITRPETTEFDTKFEGGDVKFQYPKPGRWIVHIKATVGKISGYFSIEIDSREVRKIRLLDPFVSHKRLEKIKREEEERVKRLLSNE